METLELESMAIGRAEAPAPASAWVWYPMPGVCSGWTVPSKTQCQTVDSVLSDVIFQIKAEIWTFVLNLQLLNIVE